MKGLIKVLVTISAVFAIISCLIIVAVADENEIVVEDQETVTPHISDELFAICLSTPSDSFNYAYSTTNNHPSWCRGKSGVISQGNNQYFLDCYCVDHSITSSVSVHVYYTTENLSVDDVSETNQNIRSAFPNVKFISNASEDYNCHSYAWYSQDVLSNNYWMDRPHPYYEKTDLYVEVSTPQVGDIICYFNRYDLDDNMHSGIIASVGSDVYTHVVQSKWGVAGLYEHSTADCPYPSMGATVIKYYRRTNHTHTFAKSNYDPTWHKKYCTGCGVTIREEHDYSTVVSKNSSGHTVRCACGDSITQSHSYDYQAYSEYHHKKYCDCGYINYVAHNYEYTYVNDQTHTKTCTLCHASYQDPHYEEAYSVEDNGDGTHDITCICQRIFDEDASHVYNEYGYYNGVYHKISCICGDYELEEHTLDYPEYDSTEHSEICEICGYDVWVEHEFVLEKSYANDRYHTASCLCGASQRVPHDEYTEISRNNSFHTIQITCCGTRTVTNIHYFDEYSSTAHTGQCHFCGYTANNVAHSIGYYDCGNGMHSGTCLWCDYTHSEPHAYMYTCNNYQYHQVECEKCDEYLVLEEHSWDDGYDEDGNWCTFCIDCEYILQIHPLSLDMIAKLPAEIQTAMQSAPQNALQNVQSNGNVYYVIPIDEEYGILYLNGEYYLLYSPAPDAELFPAPMIPGEGGIS